MGETQQQKPDGTRAPAEPIGTQGFLAKAEEQLRKLGLNAMADVMAKVDERKLGK